MFLGKPSSINGEHDTEAVYVGAVGARFEQPNLMEWQEMITSKSTDSGSKDFPIVNLFLKFYLERLKFENLDFQGTFNAPIYKERITISAETYLLEANQRGKLKESKVHVVVVGLGLGVWQNSDHQVGYFSIPLINLVYF